MGPVAPRIVNDVSYVTVNTFAPRIVNDVSYATGISHERCFT